MVTNPAGELPSRTAVSDDSALPAEASTYPEIVRSLDEMPPGSPAPLLVLDRLERFLDAGGFGAGPVRATRLGEGLSNITYRIVRDGVDLVLRRPPRPPTPPGLYDVLREGDYIRAMVDAGVPVPRLLMSVQDTSVLGVPFLMMERVEGLVITDSLPPCFEALVHGEAIIDELVDGLVRVHRVGWRNTPLAARARAGGFLERQLRIYASIWEQHRTRDIAEVDEVTGWLRSAMPEDERATVVHGDYRLGNVMFAPGAPPRLVAILDWELANVGDPLFDLGYLLASYPSRRMLAEGVIERQASVVQQAGFPEREHLVARYEERMQREVRSHTPWYVAMALWRTAIGLETIYRRALEGNAESAGQHEFRSEVPRLARRAAQIARGQDPVKDR